MEPISVGTIAIEETIKHAVSHLDKIWEKMKLRYNKYMIPQRENFEEYLNRTYNDIYHTKPRILSNCEKCLKDIYVPLTITADSLFDKPEEHKIEIFPAKLMDYKKILIEDDAGMGKSTLSKKLFLDVVENGNWGIPIFIELRRLKNDHPLLSEILEQLQALDKEINKELVLDFFQEGGFIFFFDGYDEIALDHKQKVTEQLKSFISRANNNIFFITSRKDATLSCFTEFRTFRIKPLTINEAYSLLKKYDERGNVSTKIIEKLKEDENKNVIEFLKNPLLVSLLFTAFDYKETIPLKKNEFYRQVFEAFFDKHDLSKDGYQREKKSKLSCDEFDRVLRRIGFHSVKKQIFEYSTDEFLNLINETKVYTGGLTFENSSLMYDLLQSVPLFNKVGVKYGWCHKSMAEYFAAEYIFKDTKENQSTVLRKLYEDINNWKFENLFDLYYDIDPCGFRQSILLPCLTDYQKDIPTNELNPHKDSIYRQLYKQNFLIYIKPNCDASFDEFETYINQLIKKEYPELVKQFKKPTSYIHFEQERINIYIGRIPEEDSQKRLFLSILSKKKIIKAPKIQSSNRYLFIRNIILKNNIATNAFFNVNKDLVSKLNEDESQFFYYLLTYIDDTRIISQRQCNELLTSIQQEKGNDPLLEF